jgi:hypothetical protein
VTLDPQRRAALLEAKLGALVRDHAGEGPAVFGPFGGGAALVREGEAWVLAEEQPGRALGRAMAWARQQGGAPVNVAAEADTGSLARRALAFRSAPAVWRVDGRSLVAAAPEPLPDVPKVDPRVLDLAPLIVEGGAEPVVEHGVLVGEVAGLEVCRAVVNHDTDAVRLEVGVGVHDREAFQLLHGDVPPVEALAGVVAKVAPHRRAGADPHPLHRLAAERLLRHRLIQEPWLVGAAALAQADPPEARTNLRDAVPCVATGLDPDGRPLVVVCSVGIDLDVVPFAADARLAAASRAQSPGAGDGARLVLAVPDRDAHPVTLALAADLVEPADVIGVGGEALP